MDTTPSRTSLAALAALGEELACDEGRWRSLVPSALVERVAVRLLDTEAHDAWLLGWPSGSSVSPHDHGDAHGVLRVIEGELVDLRWSAGARSRRRLRAGDGARLPVGLVHDVLAPAGPALSVHLYSPPLREMGFYDGDGMERLRVTAVDVDRRAVPIGALGAVT